MPAGDAGERVRARGTREADCRGRSVLFVIGMEDKDAVHRAGKNRVHLVVLGRYSKTHAEEVRCIVPARSAGETKGWPAVVFERARRDRRHLRDHAVLGDLALYGIIDIG